MRWLAWILVLVGIAVSSVWFGLMWRMYSIRHDFEIAARSPQLVTLIGFSVYVLSMSVLIQWLLMTAGTCLPCWVITWISYFVLGMGQIPFLIRMVRLVVAYSQAYRFKFARYVKWTPMARVWAVICAGISIRGAFFTGSKSVHFSSNTHRCFYFDDIKFTLAIMVLAGFPALMVARSLIHVYDAFRIRQEMERAIGFCIVIQTVIFVIQILVFFEELPDSTETHLVVEGLALAFGVNVLSHSLIVPLVAHYKNHGWRKQAVIPVADDSDVADMDGVHALATKGGEMAQRFGRFVQENLCMESWDFIVDAVQYETQSSRDPDEQFDAFLIILDQYLLPISPDEVNISSKMSKRMASFKTREAFVELDQEGRLTILQEPLDEIVRMLEQNLLNKFQSRLKLEMEAKKEAQRAEAKGDTQLLALMNMSHESNSRQIPSPISSPGSSRI